MAGELVGLPGAAGGAYRLIALVGRASVGRVEDRREAEVGRAGQIVVPGFQFEAQQHHHERNREEHQREADPVRPTLGLSQLLRLRRECRRALPERFEVFGWVGPHSWSLLPMLQAEHSVWRLCKAVTPPPAHGVMWSTWSVTPGVLTGLAP